VNLVRGGTSTYNGNPPPITLGNNMRELVVRGLRENESDNEAERGRLERALEIGLEDTFPASNPIAVAQP
jgi:hypothetical protein